MEEVLRAIPTMITEEQNAMLAMEFVKAEVDKAPSSLVLRMLVLRMSDCPSLTLTAQP